MSKNVLQILAERAANSPTLIEAWKELRNKLDSKKAHTSLKERYHMYEICPADTLKKRTEYARALGSKEKKS